MKRNRLLLTLSLFLSLLIQAQGVFACQIDESHSGALEHCCCEADNLEAMSSGPGCCDFGVEWQVTGSDPDDRYDALFLDIQPLLKLPPTALASLPLLPSRAVQAVSYLKPEPSDSPSGRSTYLTTLRLRI
ncbi:hypothetical protein [Litorivivens sp.]|uniref:hypothetical protein n=1 Tax=Litorivivens sp. TaxID=2020868 RepID=UPI003565704A